MAIRLRVWWCGEPRTDPEGYPARVGALWARLFLPKRWALVVRQTTWFKREEDWQLFLSNRWWRAHEQHHHIQEREQFKNNALRYVLAFAWQYVAHRSHDRAPLEIEANLAADRVLVNESQSES